MILILNFIEDIKWGMLAYKAQNYLFNLEIDLLQDSYKIMTKTNGKS